MEARPNLIKVVIRGAALLFIVASGGKASLYVIPIARLYGHRQIVKLLVELVQFVAAPTLAA